MKYIIVDKTSNTGRIYVGECGELHWDKESALVFNSEAEADDYIKLAGWENWATSLNKEIA